jgi:hypothetical protein
MSVERNRTGKDITDAPTFRTIDGLSIRFAESEPRGVDALLLSPWPESVLAYEPTWPQLAGHSILSRLTCRGLAAPSAETP